MALDFKDYIPTHPGLSTLAYAHARARVPEQEGEFGGFPASWLSNFVETDTLGIVDVGAVPYSTNMWVETKDNNGTITPISTGLKLEAQNAPSANDDVAINGIKAFTPASGKTFFFTGTFRVSSVNASTGVGCMFGFVPNGATEHMSADPTDGVFAYLTEGTALLKVRARGNSGTAANSGTLATVVADTDYRVTVVFKLGATAAESWGFIYAGAVTAGSPGTYTGFTTDQVTQIFAILTSPPDLSAHFGQRIKDATKRNTVIRKFYAGVAN